MQRSVSHVSRFADPLCITTSLLFRRPIVEPHPFKAGHSVLAFALVCNLPLGRRNYNFPLWKKKIKKKIKRIINDYTTIINTYFRFNAFITYK